MWHEARKQEKKIRGILVNHKRRAERRREFYEKMKADPTQFLQLHGRPVKIHLDPAVALAADSPANMMPWPGRSDILIDRFDVRAHLDYIPEHPENPDVPSNEDLSYEDRMGNYERYRIIVQNEFLGIEEDKFLHQLNLEEKFGPTVEVEKKSSKIGKGAAIPYSYEDSTPQPEPQETGSAENQEEEEEEDDSDIDFDLCVDVNQVNAQQATDMNVYGSLYGMTGNDFFSFLTRDIEEKESIRMAREQEEEKALFSGRKSRRERRAYREKRLLGRKISPPSYAARSSPTYDPYRRSESKSRSRSHSPAVPSGQITYITSFGGEEEEKAEKPPVAVANLSQSSSSSNWRNRHLSALVENKHTIDRSSVKSRQDQDKKYERKSSPKKYNRERKSRSPSDSKYRKSNRSSPSSQLYQPDQSSSRSPSESSKYRRSNRSRSPDSPRHKRRKSNSRSPGRYRRGRSRTPESPRYRQSNSPRYHRNRRSRSRSDSPRRRRSNKSRSRSAERRSRSKTRSPPPPPVRRYYGSRRGKSSSLDLEDSSDSEVKQTPVSKPPPHKNSSSEFGNSGAGSKHQPKENARERLKKKMQTLLNRQYKADKKAERSRLQKQQDERQEREEELRELAIKLRRRERERRHRDRGDSEDETGSWRSSSSASKGSDQEGADEKPGKSSWRDDDPPSTSKKDRNSVSPDTRRRRLVDY